MPIINPDIPPKRGLNLAKDIDDPRYDGGYEQGGLVYFSMNGKKMVLVVREKEALKRHLGGTLQEYLNSEVTDDAYDAALAIESLMPNFN
jgi:hypothetical protein